jgi:hypothetical protein
MAIALAPPPYPGGSPQLRTLFSDFRSSNLAARSMEPLAAQNAAQAARPQATGRIFWFTWNRLYGSYFFFSLPRRW